MTIAETASEDRAEVGQIADRFREGKRNSVLVLFSSAGRGAIHVTLTDDLVGAGRKAGDLVNRIAALSGGKGGGRPHFASAGAGDPAKLSAARAATPELVSGLACTGGTARDADWPTGWTGTPAAAPPALRARVREHALAVRAGEPLPAALALRAAARGARRGRRATRATARWRSTCSPPMRLITLALLAQAQTAPGPSWALRRRRSCRPSGPARDRSPLPSPSRRWTTAPARSSSRSRCLRRMAEQGVTDVCLTPHLRAERDGSRAAPAHEDSVCGAPARKRPSCRACIAGPR